MTTHIVVTLAGSEYLPLILSGLVVITGTGLSIATRYPLAAWTGTCMALAGWLLTFAVELEQDGYALMVTSAAFASWQAIRMWQQRETVR